MERKMPMGLRFSLLHRAFMKQLMAHLTEEEVEVYKRGRNAKVNSASKHSTLSDYHAATGMEALFGWLHLKGRQERINELFTLIINSGSLS